MGEPRFVAISTDPNDRVIHAGPNPHALPEPPEGRRWVEEFRALTNGYGYTEEYHSEEWSETEAPPIQPPAVGRIHTALESHLTRSTAFLQELRDNPTMNPTVNQVLIRHEKALNLMLRVLLEVFDSDPPEWVTRENR